MALAQPKPFDAGDSHQVDTRAKRVKLAQLRADEDFRSAMGVPGFRAFMWELLTRCHLFEISADLTSPHNTYFREGERNVGLRYLNDIVRLCPDQYRVMSEEATKREEELNG